MMNDQTPPKVELPQQFDFSNGSTDTYLIEARHGLIRHCIYCKQFRPVLLDGKDYFNYFVRGAGYVQDNFPYLDAPSRELLMTGTHPQCWDSIFAGNEASGFAEIWDDEDD